MRITKIESRIIGYDVAEAWLPEGPPDGLHSTWYHVLVRHVPHRRGRHRLHDAEHERAGRPRHGRRPALGLLAGAEGRGPHPDRVPLGQAAARQPPRVQPVRRGPRLDRRGALGHRRQGREPADLEAARPRPREGAGLPDGLVGPAHARDRLQRGEAASRRRASTASRSSSGTGWTRTSRATARRARPSGPTSR